MPLKVTSPLTVDASRFEVCAFSITMSPLVVSADQQCAREVSHEIDSGSRGATSPLDALMQGAACYFEAMAQQGRARLLLVEAPSILNVEQRLQISALAGEQELREGLADALPAATLAQAALPELTALVSAAFDHAALAIAAGASPEKFKAAMHLLLSQLLAPTANPIEHSVE